MSGPSDEDVRRVVDGFRSGVLPKADWTHTAHLITGTWHVYHLGAPAALEALRAGILALNDFHGTPNTDTRGYHETITRAYVELIDDALARGRAATVFDAARSVVSSDLAHPRVLLRYYSEARLMSVEARRSWCEPDLVPLQERCIEIPGPEAQRPKPEARISPLDLQQT